MSSSKKSASKARREERPQAGRPKKKKSAAKAAPAARRKGVEELARLLEIMARLRRPGDGCPWDLEQTIDTIKPNLIEEAYEALDAMESGNREHLAEELGDLLLQIVFQSQIAAQEGSFNFADVAKGISDKLIRRHPHIFGDVKVADSKEVLRNWDAIKKTEKKARVSALDGVPKHVPPLHRAYQLQKQAARVNFDWSDIRTSSPSSRRRSASSRKPSPPRPRAHIVEEIGDLLFSVVNVARFMKVDPAYALELTNAKFIRRFRASRTRSSPAAAG
jgi:MazG family protein